MTRKTVTIHLTILFLAVVHSAATAQDVVDTVLKKDRDKQNQIVMKDKEHQARILEQFNKFTQRIMKMAPGFKLQIPIHPGYADSIKQNTSLSKYKKDKTYFAYVGEPYRLRSGPSDGNLKDAILVKRGTRVQVLMMPDLDEKAEKKNVTAKWVLIKTPPGDEGYIPIDLLLKSPPVKAGHAGNDFNVQGSSSFAGSDEPKKMRVMVDQLNVRSEPNVYSQKIDMITKNNIVDVIEFSSNSDYIDGQEAKWAKIRYRYIEGWVFSAYLGDPGSFSDGGAGDDVLQEFTSGATLYVKSDILRVRDAPSPDGTVLFSLNHRDQVEVTEVEGDVVSLAGRKSRWLGIKHGDYEGWTFGAFLGKNSSAFMEGDDIDRQFIFPFNDPNLPISSNYGWRNLKGSKNYHSGIDIAAAQGTPVLAAADGSVISIRENNMNCASCSYGNCIILQHANGHRSLYGHLSQIGVSMGQKIMAGDAIGKAGNTGHSYGSHLHFEIIAYEEHVDPSTYIHAFLDMIYDFFHELASR